MRKMEAVKEYGMMMTVMVVDDEYLVRRGIKETIDWES